jgi:hypothetical protein
MLLLTLRGTPTLYYGDELGIGRVTISPEAMQDTWEKNEPGLGLSRDPVYERKDGGERILICLNLGDREQMVSVPEGLSGAVILVSTHLDRTGPISDLNLRPNEGLTILMAS